MKRSFTLFILLFTLSIFSILSAKMTDSKSSSNDGKRPDSLRSFLSKDTIVSHYSSFFFKSFRAEREISINALINSSNIDRDDIRLNKSVSFQDLLKYRPTAIDKYGNIYRNGGFQFPINFGNYNIYEDEDVIESWEYQKHLMYPYGHTPIDFYDP